MMRMHLMRMLLAGLAAMLVAACGIPEDEHQSALDKIKSLKADLAAQKKSCDETIADLDSKNKTIGDENSAMKAKLVALGQDLTKVKTQAGGYLQDIGQKEAQIAELLKAQEAAKKRAAMFRDLLNKFKSMIDSGKLAVEIRKGKMIVKMSDKILFDPGKDKIKKEGEAALVEVAQILAQIPDRHFQVAGHTDNVPIRSRRFKSNWELSTARAVNVVKFLAANGMDPKRLSAAGYSEYDPVGDNTADDGRTLNRRIEITLMPSIEELPKIGE
jgi:chemotaxis protein MotB